MISTKRSNCKSILDALLSRVASSSSYITPLLVQTEHDWNYVESWLHLDKTTTPLRAILSDFYTLSSKASEKRLQAYGLNVSDDDTLIVLDKRRGCTACRRRALMPPIRDVDDALQGSVAHCDDVEMHVARVVQRELVGTGLHATLSTTLALVTRQRVAHCSSVAVCVLEMLPRDVFVDAHQLAQLEAFDGARALAAVGAGVDLEAAAHARTAHALAVTMTHTIKRENIANHIQVQTWRVVDE
jgi:hypothetical protein